MEEIMYTHAKALVDIEDDIHLYCKKGIAYEILFDEGDGLVSIYCEQEYDNDFMPMITLRIELFDPDFEFLVLEDDADMP